MDKLIINTKVRERCSRVGDFIGRTESMEN